MLHIPLDQVVAVVLLIPILDTVAVMVLLVL